MPGREQPRHRTPLPDVRLAVALACCCAAAGLFTIYGTVGMLLQIWRSDDLKSMGLLVPFVSFALILRAWRGIGWETEGSWWGFAILASSALLMFVRDRTLFIVTVNKNWLLQLPPLPLVAVIYGLGMVLLFGGKRLLRAAWFPVLFLWAVIPVPQTFSNAIDLPLQHASATVARGFAHLIGERLTPDALRLMFTPDFGMFIAPGCDGIRGSVTLGLAAIVVGYLYRFRWKVYVPVVAGAVLLGYVFNFLRLCLLVLYYKIALPHPWLQIRAKTADYLIGGCLFVVALAIFFTVANRLRQDLPEDVSGPDDAAVLPGRTTRPAGTSYLAKVAAVLALSAVFGFDALHTHIAEAKTVGHAPVLLPMPEQVGAYRLVRSWQETLIGGTVVYTWGEYAPDASVTGSAQGLDVALGISPVLGVHDAEVCHMARGDEPTWHGQISAGSPGGTIDLTAATYNDGGTQRLEASSVCADGVCRQFSETSKHVTLVYAYPHKALPMQSDSGHPVPVLLKVEVPDASVPESATRPRLEAALTHFLEGADLANITMPYSRQ